MRSRSTLLALLLPVLMVAQDWELFPLDQRSYFQRMSWGNRELVDLYLMDSIRVVGEEETHFFKSRLEVGGAEHCTEEIVYSYPSVHIYESNPYAIGTLRQRGDTVFYEHNGSANPFFFLPKAAVGESWTIVSTYPSNTYQEITITCASIEDASFWGVTDSVKTYTMAANGSSPSQVAVSNFTMRLSRTYGLLEFVPFDLFLFHPPNVDFISTKCLGIDRNDIQLGFKLPGIAEHFQHSPGDLRLWKRQIDPVMQPSIITYHLDSVVEVLSTTDTIRTRSLRWSQHQDQSITGPVQIEEVFTLNGSGAILDCPSDWVAAGHDQIWRVWDPIFIDLWVKDAIVISPDTVLGDTIVTSHLFTAGYQVDTASCSFHQPTDTSFSLEMKTGLGLVELCHFGNYPYQNCFTLVGYRISGVVNGPIALSMREHNSSHETPKLFPNPVNDLLFIRGDHSGQPRMCEVIDASGKVVLATQYAGDGISVSDLPKGIYVLRIHDISGQQHARFVKY